MVSITFDRSCIHLIINIIVGTLVFFFVDPGLRFTTFVVAQELSDEQQIAIPDAKSGSGETPIASAGKFYNEVAAFTLKGKRARNKLYISDLEIIVTDEGDRYFPLFRLLRALNVEKTEKDFLITFQPEGSPPIVLDLQKKTINKNKSTQALNFIDTLSEISMEREIFLPPTLIADLFSMEIEWDDLEYSFLATTEKSLEIWKREKSTSLFSIRTKEILSQLPEAHPPAFPGSDLFSLDFMELKARAKLRAVDPTIPQEITFNAFEQSLWGSFIGGRYKLRIREPSATWAQEEFSFDDDPPLMLDWVQWRRRFESTEIVTGDSVFGLNHLVFPTLQNTGIRFNGLLGVHGDALARDRSGLGVNGVFVLPQTFSGLAPLGATVELILNDRIIDTEEVLTSLPSQPGTGRYSFEDVSLAPGSLNNLIIKITETDGEVTIIEKKILGSSTLLPRGSVAFLSSLGTDRDIETYNNRGLFIGGRLLYGLTDNFTIGSTCAYQKNFFQPATLDSYDLYERQYPVSSFHTGAQFTWQPFDNSLLSGYFSWVTGDDGEEDVFSKNIAYSLEYAFAPRQDLNLDVIHFFYGPNFFNGTNRDLMDREGYVINPKWRPHSMLSISTSLGRVKNNVTGDLLETLSADFQNLTLSTRVIPKSTLRFSFDRLSPSWDEETKEIISIGLRSYLSSGISFNGIYATGNDLSLEENDFLFQGLSLPGISFNSSRSTSLNFKKKFSNWGGFSLGYSKSDSSEDLSLSHTKVFNNKITLEMRTELGYQYDTDSLFFENISQIPLNASKKTNLIIRSRLEKEEWRVEVTLTLNELFSFFGRRPNLMKSQSRINPEKAIIYGKVFVDSNANAVFDEGEQGLEGMEVFLNNTRSVESNDDGEFFYAVSGGNTGEKILHLKGDGIPAIYSCTHGQQHVNCREGEVTEVNFGLAPLNVIMGRVVINGIDMEQQFASGIKVTLTPANGDDIKLHSITASDGSYYLEDIRPGEYHIQLDPETIGPGMEYKRIKEIIKILPSNDPQELTLPDIKIFPKSLISQSDGQPDQT